MVDYVVPLDAYFVLTAVAWESLGLDDVFALIDASTGDTVVGRYLVRELAQPGATATEQLGVVFPPGAQVAWKHTHPVVQGANLVDRLLEGYLVRHNRFASQ